MIMERIPNHFNVGLVKLIPPFFGKPRIASLMLAIMNRVQELEDATWDVLDRYTLEGADDARLTVLGRVVGQPNLGWDTETYRAVLRGKIRANRSRGLAIDIIEVVQAITPTRLPVYVADYAPATLYVWAAAAVGVDIEEALRFLLPKTRAAGVQMHVMWTEDGIDTGMVWDESNWDNGDVAWNTEIM